MKVSILTLHAVSNYGTQLQAYATQEKLKEYFDEVEFINYKRKDTYGKELVKTFSNCNTANNFQMEQDIWWLSEKKFKFN